MPVIAVVNRKGGSGKTTLATHISAWCAAQGLSVMLGDVDRQQSTRSWLKARQPGLPSIAPWAIDQKNMLRVPSGITHVVLDTPGGLHGFELARVVMFADAIVVPVCHSAFDRDSAAQCIEELKSLPRVASGRCRVATVGMRIDGRTRGAEVLDAWSEKLGVAFLGTLRDTQNYVHSIERGITIFDMPPGATATDRAQWQPLLAWLDPIMRPALAANDPAAQPGGAADWRNAPTRPPHATVLPAAARTARTARLMPQQEALLPGTRLAAASTRAAPSTGALQKRPPVLGESAAPALPIPHFLKKSRG
jgi:chromosome partitioning protein